MRVAVLADIHGNSIALDAVLTDIEASGGTEGYWLLGDLVAIGYDPVGVLERLAELPNAISVRGNTDQYVVTSVFPKPTMDDVRADPSLLKVFMEINRGFAWTQGCLAANDWLEWMDALPLDYHLNLPDETRALLVHASPGQDDGLGMNAGMTDEELAAQLGDPEADLVMIGHTHWPFDRTVNDVRIINPGSVSNPFPPDLRASYVMLTIGEKGHEIEFRRVDYDHQAVIDAVKRVRHPSGEYIIGFQQGRLESSWLRRYRAAGGKL
jgi:putative phosphoesterase